MVIEDLAASLCMVFTLGTSGKRPVSWLPSGVAFETLSWISLWLCRRMDLTKGVRRMRASGKALGSTF